MKINLQNLLNQKRLYIGFGLIYFIGLLIFSIVYAKERVSHIDSSWIFFQQVNDGNFAVAFERWGAFIPQIPLFIGVKMHLPLSALIVIFSISYVLVPALIWLTCISFLNNKKAALLVILGTVVGIRELFLFTVSETHLILCWSALLVALLEWNPGKYKIRRTLFCVICLLIILFSHPLGIFTAGFSVIYFMIQIKSAGDKTGILLLLLAVCYGIYIYFFPANPYDTKMIMQINNRIENSTTTTNAAIHFLSLHLSNFYWLPVCVLMIAVSGLFFQKEYLKLAALVLGIISYALIAAIIFKSGDSAIMLERVWLPAFFMANLAFADIRWSLSGRIASPVLTLLTFAIIVNGIRFINIGCLTLKKRTKLIDQLIEQSSLKENQLYTYYPDEQSAITLRSTWSLPVESLILSSLHSDKSISISTDSINCPEGFIQLNSFTTVPVSKLNSKYFKVKNPIYVKLKTDR